ncbi:MAG: 4Fe-4S dicluster domain-containing protein [Desulfatirhabdiaceae bacterium]
MNIVCVEIARCIACRSCERVCFFHQLERHNGHRPNIFVHVDMEKRRIITATCHQCEMAECMTACPSGAITRDSLTGAVIIDKSLCVGCGLCVEACPFGSIQIDDIQQTATKCDLCGGHPQCVDVCMAKALHFCSIRELMELKHERKDLKIGIRAVHADEDGQNES